MSAVRTFRSIQFGTPGRPAQQSLGVPAAAYPGRIATNSDLIVAVDRQQSQLLLPMGAADTSMTLIDASSVSAYNLLTIENEIVKTTGPAAGNVVPVSRGFDGTAPAAHAAGAAVAGFIDAWHHNAAIAEIQAIEQALGPNLANVPAASLITAPSYNFPAQTPGGALNPGTNSILLSPVPRGVNGTDTNHYLYISGGTGTAEAVLITGGTAISGAASGTVFVTCANAHSGAWTIQTATAGAQEAEIANPGANIVFPAGTFDFFGPYWNHGNSSITGAGMQATILRWNQLSASMFNIQRSYFNLRNVTLRQVGTPVAGSNGVYFAGSGSNVAGAACDYALLQDVYIVAFYTGVYNMGDGGSVDMTRVQISNCVGDGIHALSAQGYWYAIVTQSNSGNGIYLGKAAGSAPGWVPFMEGIQTFNNKGWGLYCASPVNVGGQPSFFNNDMAGEIYVNFPSSSSADNGFIQNAWVQFAGQSISFGTLNTAPGILVDVGSGPVVIHNVHLFACQGNGIDLEGALNSVLDSRILGSGQGGQAGHLYNIRIGSGTSDEIINGNFITNGISRLDGATNTITSNFFSGTSASPLVYFSSGTDIIFDKNQLQQSGAGPAYQVDSGVTMADGVNEVVLGTVVSNGFRAVAGRAVNLFREYSIGAAVASAATITASAEVFHVTGAATIQTINPPAGTGYPRITIIADGAFILGSAGNIGITANVTATVGRAIYLQYDSNTAKWYPD